ncbi:MAG: transposase [Kiritimatiellae bacterium]|nr:transposase [Verrucomicrobiota bacterium]MCG2660124.1 transposase [Kiritimatiellia bacterium]
MKGKQRREEPMFACVRLEELIPAGHILRKIDRWIDFSIIHEKTEDLYSSTGRPSIDPEVLIRMMVVGYLYGITSERRLCREVQLNLGYRWFCGLTLEDKVPDHSTFSKNRYGRFSESGLFRGLFQAVVKQAQQYGLVKGQHLTVDATTVQANASLGSLEEIIIPYEPEEYLDKVERENPAEEPLLANTGKKLSNETHISRTDPDARIFRKQFEKTKLAYSDNVLMDNTSRVILDVEITEPNLHQEGQVAGEMLERSRFAYGIKPETIGGDKAYGSGPAVRSICEAGVKPHVGVAAPKGPHIEGIYPKEDFIHDQENDELICPAGKRLWRRTTHKRNRQIEYVSSKADCKGCARKSLCTRAPCRVVHRHLDKDFLDYAADLRSTDGYRISQRCRKKVEMLFGEAKEFMGLRYARRRGYRNLMEQCLITAMVQNIKRIIQVFEEKAPIITQNCINWVSNSLLYIIDTARKTISEGKKLWRFSTLGVMPSPC